MLSATPPLSRRQLSLPHHPLSPKNHLCHNNNNLTVNQTLSSQYTTIYTKTSRNKRRSASLPDLAQLLKTHTNCSQTCGRTKSVLEISKAPVSQHCVCEPSTSSRRSSHNWPTKRNGQQYSQRRSSNRMGSALTIMTPTSMSTDRTTNGRDLNGNGMNVRVPIVGYEVMEKRAKFTVNCGYYIAPVINYSQKNLIPLIGV